MGVGVGPLGDEVVDVVRPVLDRGVADLRAGQRNDLHHRSVESIRGVDRGGTALDVVDLGPFVHDDQRPLELAGVLRVDAEIGLQRQRDLDAFGHVHERSAGPDRAIEGSELVVLGRDDGREVLPEEIGVFLEPLVGAHEDDAYLRELLPHAVVDDFRVVLRADAGQELALRFRDSEPFEGLLDLVRDVVPGLLFALGWLAVVDDLVQVDLKEIAAPGRHRAGKEVLVGAKPEVEHPLRLVLDPADLLDRLASQAAFGLLEVLDVVVEAKLVLARHDLRGGCHSAPWKPLADSAGDPITGEPGRRPRAILIPTYIIGIGARRVKPAAQRASVWAIRSRTMSSTRSLGSGFSGVK